MRTDLIFLSPSLKACENQRSDLINCLMIYCGGYKFTRILHTNFDAKVAYINDNQCHGDIGVRDHFCPNFVFLPESRICLGNAFLAHMGEGVVWRRRILLF